jgi:hypothetical protein
VQSYSNENHQPTSSFKIFNEILLPGDTIYKEKCTLFPPLLPGFKIQIELVESIQLFLSSRNLKIMISIASKSRAFLLGA